MSGDTAGVPEPPLLEVVDLKTHFPIREGVLMRTTGYVRAVDGVSLTVRAGETLGLVGESGSGKSTLGKSILRLVEPHSGEIRIRGKNVIGLPKSEMFPFRRTVQMVFQDPYSSLNPRIPVGRIVAEGLRVHGTADGRAADAIVEETFDKVGLTAEQTRRFAHEFSGGQRQRIGIARALALSPGLIIADEPVSALDVSVQAQVINLFMDLQQSLGLAYLFIAHDLAVVAHVCHRIAVMYLGRVVEVADRDELFRNPLHPYTETLMAAIPVPDPDRRKTGRAAPPRGEIPSPSNPPSGCAFYPRCPLATEICKAEAPALLSDGTGHGVACHHRR